SLVELAVRLLRALDHDVRVLVRVDVAEAPALDSDLHVHQVRIQGGGFRYVDAHEYAHIMIERAEKAYREFDEGFHGRIELLRPMAIFLPARETTGAGIREAYFRNKNAPMIYSS